VGKVVPVLVISPLILYSSMLMGVVLQQGNLVVVVLRVLLEGQQCGDLSLARAPVLVTQISLPSLCTGSLPQPATDKWWRE